MTDTEQRAHDIALTMLSTKMQVLLSLESNAALELMNQTDFIEVYCSYYNAALKKLD